MFKLKFILLIIFLQLSIHTYSQNSFNVTVHQDTKFIFIGDEIGNHRGTINILLKVELPLIEFSKSHVFIFPSYEYAGLHGGTFTRYSLGVGYTHNDVYFKKLNLGLYLDSGAIFRMQKKSPSFGLGVEVSYRLTKRFSLSYVHQMMERTDLKLIYNEDSFVRNSSFMGFKIHL